MIGVKGVEEEFGGNGQMKIGTGRDYGFNELLRWGSIWLGFNGNTNIGYEGLVNRRIEQY